MRLISMIALVAVAPALSAQEKPAAQAQEKPQVAEASAIVSPKSPISIPVSGVTKENAPKIQEAVQKIVHPGFACAKCQITLAKEGNCPKCNAPLQKETSAKPVAKTIQVEADKGTIKLALDAGRTVKLSEIESAAKAAGATIKRTDLALPSWSRIIVAGPATPDSAAKLEKALMDAKVFASVDVEIDEVTKQLYVLPEVGASGAKLGAATAAIEKAGTDYKFQDVVFAAPCAECTKAGMAQAACADCWGTT